MCVCLCSHSVFGSFLAAFLAASLALVMVISCKSMEIQVAFEGGKIVSVSTVFIHTTKSVILALFAGKEWSNWYKIPCTGQYNFIGSETSPKVSLRALKASLTFWLRWTSVSYSCWKSCTSPWFFLEDFIPPGVLEEVLLPRIINIGSRTDVYHWLMMSHKSRQN